MPSRCQRRAGPQATLRAATAVVAGLVSLTSPGAPPGTDALLEGLQQERLRAGSAPLEQRASLDAAARRRTQEMAALPEERRMNIATPVEQLLAAEGVRRVRRAALHVDLQTGPLAPQAALERWRGMDRSWQEALDPALDGVGIGVAVDPSGWRILAVILVEDLTLPADLEALAAQVEAQVNQRREDHGLGPLAHSAAAAKVARRHSADMALRGYMDHRSPDGVDPAARARQAGIRFRKLAENVARNRGVDDPVTAAVNGWMESPGHRRNILDRELTHSGVGVAVDDDGMVYFTQLFLLPR